MKTAIGADGKISPRNRLRIASVMACEIRDGLRTGKIDEPRAVQLAIWIMLACDASAPTILTYRPVFELYLGLADADMRRFEIDNPALATQETPT